MNVINNSQITTEKNGHYYWLDLIRFLAAFAVLACHFRGAFFEEYSLLPTEQQNSIVFSFYFITRLGFEAVLIFFVLSGFLVGGKAIMRIKTNTFHAEDYVIDRFARIMLPLVSSLLFYLPICLYFDIPTSVMDWIGSLLSLQGILTSSVFATLWSLSYEVWFYILMFSIAVILTQKNKAKFGVGVVILVLSMLVFVKLKASYLYVWLLSACLFALYKPNVKSLRSVCAISLIVSALIIILLQVSSNSRFLSIKIGSAEIIRDILIVVFGLSFSIFTKTIIEITPQKTFMKTLNSYGTKLAAFSYTLYLTHVPVLKLLRELGAPKCASVDISSVSLYVLWMAIAIAVAYGLYYIFERNTPAFKRFLKKRVL